MTIYRLLGASALALGIGMSAAHAEDPLKLTLSGGAQEAFGYVGNPDNKNNGHVGDIWQFGDGSIDFDAKTKLDNGITVEFNAALNISGFNDGGAARGAVSNNPANSTGYAEKNLPSSENDWIAFSGSFGKLEIGDDFNAVFQAHNDAPYFGMVGGYNWGRNSGYIAAPVLTNGPQVYNIQTVMFDDYEASKVVYTTPSFSGFGVSASFTPSANSADNCCTTLSGESTQGGGSAASAAIFYKGDVGDAKVGADFGYTYEQAGSTTRGIDVGLSVGYKGFTVGGSWLNRAYDGSNETAANKLGVSAGNTWDIGVGYETGPWGITVGYMQEEMYGGNGTAAVNGLVASATGSNGALVNGDVKWQEVPITVKYQMGPGVTLNIETGYAKWTTPDGQGADQIDGVYGLVGTTVSF
jgi:hypothetical protein